MWYWVVLKIRKTFDFLVLLNDEIEILIKFKKNWRKSSGILFLRNIVLKDFLWYLCNGFNGKFVSISDDWIFDNAVIILNCLWSIFKATADKNMNSLVSNEEKISYDLIVRFMCTLIIRWSLYYWVSFLYFFTFKQKFHWVPWP